MQERIHATWDQVSPFATVPTPVHISQIRSEGAVRYLLVSGKRDDTSWGMVGAFWLSADGERGGFQVSPESLWQGSELVRSYRGALARGWTDVAIFDYWSDLAGVAGTYMIDPPHSAESLLWVARRVGAA